MRDHFIRRMSNLVKQDPRIMLITGDLGFGVFNDFRKDFPENFINVGVAEQQMTGLATGLALEGKITFTYSIANFATLRCLEQIRNDAAYHGANVNVVAIGGGFSYGALGISHHATEDLAIMRSIPDMTVVAPCGYWETMEATAAIANQPGTAYLRLDKSSGDDTPQEVNESFHLGQARILRPGHDCTIITAGGILEEVLQAADTLTAEGIHARIMSMHTIKPIDQEAIINAVTETGTLITVEEHTIHGGLGSAVAEVLFDHGKTGNLLRIGLDMGFSSIVGSQKYLRQQYKLDAASIEQRVIKFLQK
ncbi:MAG TPA: transketolase [Candidatus Marinimicrobia bacterium]|nr:transketolase C-terminal domain-containing protein [Candidatus Neomarinimicrobiota bacterium]HBR86791.1 transketolase [Candidatus Neomarinimicrobiota bacterium]